MTVLLKKVCITYQVCGMYGSYICTDIMQASYYGAHMMSYAILQLQYTCSLLKESKVIALLK